MNKTKNLFGFFMAIAVLLVFVSLVSAATNVATIDNVKINGLTETGTKDISVIAGENINVEVFFTADENASDLRLEAEIDGDKASSDVTKFVGDVEAGKRYSVSFTMRVPYELSDDVSEDMSLNMEILNSKFKTTVNETVLRVQRPAYNADFMSIEADNSVNAGDMLSVDIVLKNIGYNELEDLYLTASIPSLGIEKRVYAGDVLSLEDRVNEESDYVRARLYLQIPYDVAAGDYILQVEAKNSALVLSDTKQLSVSNDFESNLIVSDYSKTFGVGEDSSYELVLVNPTNKLKVYRLVVESPYGLDTSVSESVVAVPAGSSKTVKILANADAEGNYDFDVSVFSGEELVETTTLTANVKGGVGDSAVVVLTIILVVVLLVLLGVLITLLRKKPEKTEEFGESYY